MPFGDIRESLALSAQISGPDATRAGTRQAFFLELEMTSLCLATILIRGFPGGASSKEPACHSGVIRTTGSVPGSGRSPGGGHGNPLQSSCLENHMDREARQAQSDMTEATSHTRTHILSTLTQRTVSGNFLHCHHPLPYVAPDIRVNVVEFQPLAMAEGPWCWD